MSKSEKRFVTFFIIIALGIIFIYLFTFYLLDYTPNDESFLQQVNSLTQFNLQEQNCRILSKEYSTNIREVSFFSIIEVNKDFCFPEAIEHDLEIIPALLESITAKVYSSLPVPTHFSYFYREADDLFCFFDYDRHWLIVDYGYIQLGHWDKELTLNVSNRGFQ